MTAITVYDSPMCCSTGICGTDVDQRLIDFAADLDWIKTQGVSVRRINLSQEPAEFTTHATINELMQASGGDDLPAILVDGTLVSKANYPSRQQLANWTGVSGTTLKITEQIHELIALGASIGANCEPCLKYHVKKSRELGLSKAQMREAIEVGRMVKQASAKNILGLADKLIPNALPEQPPQAVPAKTANACCGDSATAK